MAGLPPVVLLAAVGLRKAMLHEVTSIQPSWPTRVDSPGIPGTCMKIGLVAVASSGWNTAASIASRLAPGCAAGTRDRLTGPSPEMESPEMESPDMEWLVI